MKKITLMIFVSLLSFCSYAQLAPEDFEGTWAPVPATTGAVDGDWLILDNEIGEAFSWTQQVHNGALPSLEGTAGTHSAYINKEQVANPAVAIDFLITPKFTMPTGGVLT